MLGRVMGVLALVCVVCGCNTSGSGSDGTSGGSPYVVSQIRQTAIDKIDLLLVVDNSVSMADKQVLLSQAVPGLVERLVNPDCVQVDFDGNVVARQPPDTGECPEDWEVEFNPVDDIHIGVITSSLGGHGGDLCSPNGMGASSWNESQNDRARPLPTVRPDLNLPSDDAAGFLAWQDGSTGRSREDLKAAFAEHVLAAGESGCGYEATLEAWYRFLIDPTPPQEMVVIDDRAVPAEDANGIIVDTTLLAQRQAFLRPDSLVAIVMLTDENDCSIVDGGAGWMATSGSSGEMPPATSECDSDPNNKCCRSCGLPSDVSDCPPLEEDPNCAAARPTEEDALNLRCYNQKHRFGVDLLYPIERYVAGLTEKEIYDTQRCTADGLCPQVANPLFEAGDARGQRDASLVFLAGIVGVPWQDIATPASLADPTALEFMPADELVATGRWDLILGHPEAENPLDPAEQPLDPLMIERTEPRTGVTPVTNEEVGPATSEDPIANSINGHETVNVDNDDLQYACIFPLAEPRDCSDAANVDCDCKEEDLSKNRPLCKPAEGGEAGTMQHFAKAYPGLRLLQTLRDFGDNSIVASICPKATDPGEVEGGEQDPVFGYNPAVAALVTRFKDVLGGRCLPEPFTVDEEGRIACTVVEATRVANECDSARGRSQVDEAVAAAVAQQMAADGQCGGVTSIACESYSLCHIDQVSGITLEACQNEINYPPENVPGFCYVDAAQQVGHDALLRGCPVNQQRKLQFVGENTPASGSITYIVCDKRLEE